MFERGILITCVQGFIALIHKQVNFHSYLAKKRKKEKKKYTATTTTKHYVKDITMYVLV